MRARFGEVAKRSNAADCKSVAPAASEVRILPSPPIVEAGNAEGGMLKVEGRKKAEGKKANLPFDIRRSPFSSPTGFTLGGSNSVVESQPSKLLVAGSIPVSRSKIRPRPSSIGRCPG